MASLPTALEPVPRTSTSTPEPDPLVLPSSTSSQFVLLAVAVLAAAMYTADQAAGLVLTSSTNWAGRYQRCDVAAGRPSLRSAVQVTTDHISCLDGVNRLRVEVSGMAVATVLVVLLIAHWTFPGLVARRDRLREIDPIVYPAAHGQVDTVLAQAATAGGHDRPVDILMAPWRPAPAGRVTGRAGRYTVRLNRGLVAQVSTRGLADLRAVLRHELAHVHYGDAALTSVAVHSTWALASVAVPSLALAVWKSRTAVVAPAVRWTAVLVAVLLVRASVIRTREHYADLRAAKSNLEAGDDAFRASAFPQSQTAVAGLPGVVARLRRPLCLHPTTQARQDLVLEPDRLLIARFGEAFATGLVNGLLLPQLFAVLDTTLAWDGNGSYAGCLVVALLCTTVIGSSLWRAAARAAARGLPPPTGFRTATGLALGLMIGRTLCPTGGLSWTALTRADIQAAAMHAASWAVVLMLACVMFTRWCVEAASCSISNDARFPVVAGRRAATAIAALLWASLLHQAWRSAVDPTTAAAVLPPWSSALRAGTILLLDPGHNLPVLLAAAFLVAARRPFPRAVLGAAPAGLVLTPLALAAGAVAGLAILGPDRIAERLNSVLLSGAGPLIPAAVAFFTAPTSLVVLVVGVAAGPIGGWSRAARAILAGALFAAGPLIPLMLAVPLVPLGCETQWLLVCPSARLVTQGLGVPLDIAIASAFVSASVLTPALALWAAVHPRRQRRRAIPAGPAQPARSPRPARVIRWAGVTLTGAATACLLLVQVTLWSGLSSLMPIGPLAAFTATKSAQPPQLPSGSVTVRQACAQLTDDTQDASSVARLLATNSAALRAFGRTVEQAVQAGDIDQEHAGWRSARGFCERHA